MTSQAQTSDILLNTAERHRRLRDRALSYLQRTPASSQRLKRRLHREWAKLTKEEEPIISDGFDLIEQVCAEMMELGLIDDHAYAKGIMESLRQKGKSTRAIKAGLIQRDVPEQTIAEVFESSNISADQDRIAAAAYVRRRRLGPLRDQDSLAETYSAPDRQKQHAKDLATLLRQGFPYEIAAEIMELSGEAAFENWCAGLHND